TFIGRDDLKGELTLRILSSPVMPTFLLQGQRRVGKTSLLNFLPELLGPRFLVFVQDMQSDEFRKVADCFHGFKRRIREALDPGADGEPAPDDPLDAWRDFRAFLEEIASGQDRKLILAFDEYENFHKLIKKEGEKADDLLGAMRSFSQRQNQVVFLFTGLALFPDLGEPDFSRYFVHAQRLTVDYLPRKDAEKLILRPYEGFSLVYPPDMAARIWDLTRGHPALLQLIGHEMVNRANMQLRREMTNEDLDEILDAYVLLRDNAVMVNFWSHFCDDGMRETVREIMGGNKPSNRNAFLRLVDYGFVTKGEKPGLRAPLFERWIERHGGSFS
ncbi:MAG: ATP-binding protein, partial [Desulfobacterales bacterium]|nr:ATP-binding protein [Desulfobacterales bacterium]